jgi:hypothetical protein
MNHRSSAMVGTAVLLFLAGCEAEPNKLATVHGKVFYRGEALRSGTIVFTPDAVRGSDGPMAQAEIQPDGTFVLRTSGMPGAAPGWHRVTVVSFVDAAATPRSVLPTRYSDPEQSGLSYDIQPDRDNLININLE